MKFSDSLKKNKDFQIVYGKGKSFAFASDCAPHWARKEFMNWEGYGEFFTNMIEWLAE